MADEEKRKKGIAFFKKLTEGQPRNPSSGGRPAVPSAFSRYTMEHLFGDVWRIHFPGAKNLGVKREQLEAMITHAAHYAGWPCAATAMRVLGEVWPAEA
jgi:Carboxymuconolactone decarboxylase family